MNNNNTCAQSGGRFALKTLNCAVLCALTTWGTAQAAPYVETGRTGDAGSWRSPEFLREWGLGAINADQAYAAGYTGKGVKLGIFDQPVYARAPRIRRPGQSDHAGHQWYSRVHRPLHSGESRRCVPL